MKSISLFILTVGLFISCGEEKPAQENASQTATTPATPPEEIPGSPEEFAKKLTEHVIDSNYQAIVEMIIVKDEMVDLIRNSRVSTAGKEAAISHVDTEIGKMKMDMFNGLAEIRKSGRALGLAWENCTYKSVRYDIKNPNGYDMMQLKCVIDCNGMEHVFTVTDVVKTPKGWRLGGKMMFGDVSQ